MLKRLSLLVLIALALLTSGCATHRGNQMLAAGVAGLVVGSALATANQQQGYTQQQGPTCNGRLVTSQNGQLLCQQCPPNSVWDGRGCAMQQQVQQQIVIAPQWQQQGHASCPKIYRSGYGWTCQ